MHLYFIAGNNLVVKEDIHLKNSIYFNWEGSRIPITVNVNIKTMISC